MKGRAKAIAFGMPNALDLLVVCVEAGLSLGKTGSSVSPANSASCNRRLPRNSR